MVGALTADALPDRIDAVLAFDFAAFAHEGGVRKFRKAALALQLQTAAHAGVQRGGDVDTVLHVAGRRIGRAGFHAASLPPDNGSAMSGPLTTRVLSAASG